MPQAPEAMCSTKGPGVFQYLNPMRSWPGMPPRSMTKPKMIKKMTSRIFRHAKKNYTSPYIPTNEMPTTNVITMNTQIHTEGFKSVQNWNSTQMAEISAGTDSKLP